MIGALSIRDIMCGFMSGTQHTVRQTDTHPAFPTLLTSIWVKYSYGILEETSAKREQPSHWALRATRGITVEENWTRTIRKQNMRPALAKLSPRFGFSATC